jgi:hypothetical protein
MKFHPLSALLPLYRDFLCLYFISLQKGLDGLKTVDGWEEDRSVNGLVWNVTAMD